MSLSKTSRYFWGRRLAESGPIAALAGRLRISHFTFVLLCLSARPLLADHPSAANQTLLLPLQALHCLRAQPLLINAQTRHGS